MKKITGIVFIFIVCAVLSLTGCSNIGSRKNTFTFATWAAGVELQEFNEIINRVNQNADGKYKIEVLSVPSDYYIKLSTNIAAKKRQIFLAYTRAYFKIC